MITSFCLEVHMNDRDYCQIAINTFQKYIDDNLDGKFF